MSKLTFYKPPDIQKGYIFNPQKSFFSVIVPEETTNLIYNPETAHLDDFSVTGDDATIVLDTDEILFGISSAYVTLPLASYMTYDLITSLIPDTLYTFSVYMKGYGTVRLEIYNETADAIHATGRVIDLSPDLWTRYILKFNTPDMGVMEAANIRILGLNPNSTFWVSGLQLEQKPYATTFCSGNQSGLITGETPRPYFWTATPNQSPSIRLATTRDGGKIVSLETLGLHVTGFNGTGLPEFNIISTPVASGIGSVYSASVIESRDIEICGVLMSPTVKSFFCSRAMLSHSMQPNISGNSQPLKLLYSVYECEKQVCQQLEILAAYTSGLEGDISSLLGEEICISFTMLDPLFKALGNNAKTLNVFKEVTDYTGPVGTDINGEWQTMPAIEDLFGDNGATGDITIGPDNNLYIGGASNTSPGDGSMIARWNGIGWDSIGKAYLADGTTLTEGANVSVIIPGPNGTLYVGGHFKAIGNTNGVVSVTDGDGAETATAASYLNIARYKITTNTWEYIGRFLGATGKINTVENMKLMQDGKIVMVGNFRNPQSITELVFTLSRNLIAFDPTNDHFSLYVPNNNEIGIDDDDIIYAIDQAPNGEVWIGGDFTCYGNLELPGLGGDYLLIENVAVYGRYIDIVLDQYLGFEGATGQLTDGNIVGGAVRVIKVSSTGSVFIGGDFTADQIFDDIHSEYPDDILVSTTTVLNESAAFGFAQLDPSPSPNGWFSPFILGAMGYDEFDHPQRPGKVNDMAFDTDGQLHIIGEFNFANTYFPDMTYTATPPVGVGYTIIEALTTQTPNCNSYIIWDGTNLIEPDILFRNEEITEDDPGNPRRLERIELGALYNNRFADHSSAPIPGQFEYHMPGSGGANVNPGFGGSKFIVPLIKGDYVSKDIVFIDLGCNDYSKPIFVINGPGRLKSIINETTGAIIYFNYNMSIGESLVLDLTQPLFKLTSNLKGNLRGIINPNSTVSSFIFNGGTVGVSVNLDLLDITEDTPDSFVKWRTQYWSLDKACGCNCQEIGTYDE